MILKIFLFQESVLWQQDCTNELEALYYNFEAAFKTQVTLTIIVIFHEKYFYFVSLQNTVANDKINFINQLI